MVPALFDCLMRYNRVLGSYDLESSLICLWPFSHSNLSPPSAVFSACVLTFIQTGQLDKTNQLVPTSQL